MKRFVVLLALLLLAGCSTDCPENVCPECPEAETVYETVEVEKIVEVEVNKEIGPWTVQQEITKPGQYLVPEEMQPGQWAYISDVEGTSCWITTFSDLSGTSDSILNHFYSDNKGFFVLADNVRMAEIQSYSKDCVFSRIGE